MTTTETTDFALRVADILRPLGITRNMRAYRILRDALARIYEQEDYGYIFGIDGAGYSFFDEHFEPLYRARGLRWHDEEGETQA